MFIKAVRNDYFNKYNNQRFEVGKEYKGYHYYFTDKDNIGIINEISGYGGENLLNTKFLEIMPIIPEYDSGFGEYTSEHIKIIREIQTQEIQSMLTAKNL